MSRRPDGEDAGLRRARASTTVGRPWGSLAVVTDAGRLVEQVVDEAGRDADGDAVDLDEVVVDVDPPARYGHAGR